METLETIRRAVDYVEDHLCDDLEMVDVASHVSYSLWHFQRVFRGIVGNTLKEYIRKRRLTLAMEDLSRTQTRILDIAIAYGFESQESFSRSFKKMFGVTPGECRKSGTLRARSLQKPRIDFTHIEKLYGELAMQPTIEEFSAKHYIGMDTNYICMLSPDRNNHIVIPELWGKYLARREEIQGTFELTDYGLTQGIPEDRKKHPDEFHYVACAEVKEIGEVPQGMTAYTVPAGRYAVFTHKGTLDKLGATMDHIFGRWLPQSGESLRDAPDVEIYGAKFHPTSKDSELQYCIALH